MNLTGIRGRLVAGAVLAASASLALTLPAGAASAAESTSTVTVADTGTLDAKGAVAYVPVSLTCGAGYSASLEVSLTQNVGSGITTGTTPVYRITCDGTAQQFVVPITPDVRAFKNGVAYASAKASICDPMFMCETLVDEGAIQLTK
ncbi:hypothetical protein [Micromonospora siamensis]|uniref:Neocarzinostatin family protein n=1 Tax=Micromonospora siamensis TaxID=299152 RepID=A0A1C5I4Z3_9ACTN|nr:hypothetical protein [Micromonospora siamensis]SCG53235.1 hypothetical protein GA0074704_2904 [Micromonospora siamensis]